MKLSDYVVLQQEALNQKVMFQILFNNAKYIEDRVFYSEQIDICNERIAEYNDKIRVLNR